MYIQYNTVCMRYGLLGMKVIYVMFRNVFSKNVSKAALKCVKKRSSLNSYRSKNLSFTSNLIALRVKDGKCLVNNSVQTEMAWPLRSANRDSVAKNIAYGEECQQ